MPGYDRSRIVGVDGKELDEFTCGICFGVFADPVATQCCRQTYCRECIEEWVSLHKNCPNDRKTLTKKGLKLVPRVLINVLDNMKIKCNFESDGCSRVVGIGELAQHLKVCNFDPNRFCKTCGLTKESVLTHNCIQSLICEKQKTEEKYLKLMNEKCKEKDEIIASLRKQLAQSSSNHKNAVTLPKLEYEAGVEVAEHLMGLAIGTKGINVNNARNIRGISRIDVLDNYGFRIFGQSREALDKAKNLLDYKDVMLYIPRYMFTDVNINMDGILDMIQQRGNVRIRIEGFNQNSRSRKDVKAIFTGIGSSISFAKSLLDYQINYFS